MEDKFPTHIKTLEALLKENTKDKPFSKTIKSILTGTTTDVCETDLDSVRRLLMVDNLEVIEITAYWIAEVASKNGGRRKLVDQQLIKILFEHLCKDYSVPVNLQLCRALGNLCYENIPCNKHLMQFDVLGYVIQLVQKYMSTDEVEMLGAAVGFLQNHLLSDLNLMKQAVDLRVLELAERILTPRVEQVEKCETLISNTLFLVTNLTQHVGGANISHRMCMDLVKILEQASTRTMCELVLDIFHNEAENDEIKMLLAEAHLCELLFNMLEKHRKNAKDVEGRALLKLACDLIVLVLTGDDSMIALYGGGQGRVYLDMLTWLCSTDTDLLSTAILAIGNFARKDEHCIEMVNSGVSTQLLKILTKYNDIGADLRLQHALLSAMRNLVIPRENKMRLVQDGLIDVVYPLLNSRHLVVVFKLLGTFRMLVDGEAETALNLALRADLLEKLVEWSFSSEHPGVRAECLRLLAWLIKNCQSTEPFPMMLRIDKFMRCIVEMLASSHVVMQNEAVIALILLYTARECVPDFNMAQSLIECDVGKFLSFLLTRHGETLEKEFVENVLTLLEEFILEHPLKVHLSQADILVGLNKLSDREELILLRERIAHVLACIDSS